MNFYWVKFIDRPSACFEAMSVVDAFAAAHAHGTPTEAKSLPYPASPKLGDWISTCPPFCFQPEKCGGRTSCPRNIACSE